MDERDEWAEIPHPKPWRFWTPLDTEVFKAAVRLWLEGRPWEAIQLCWHAGLTALDRSASKEQIAAEFVRLAVEVAARELESHDELWRGRISELATPPARLDPQRSFSPAQKREIYLRGDGCCQACGRTLDDEWHADHILPHSRGGKTEVVNGQALCGPCNGRKSAKVLTVDEG